MRITIDEQSRLVHALKGAAMLTLALPRTKTREQLEAAAWASRRHSRAPASWS